MRPHCVATPAISTNSAFRLFAVCNLPAEFDNTRYETIGNIMRKLLNDHHGVVWEVMLLLSLCQKVKRFLGLHWSKGIEMLWTNLDECVDCARLMK